MTSTTNSGRRRITTKAYTAEDQALDQIAREAEAKLAAKRASRTEAREIRMKELEKQQRENEEKQDRLYELTNDLPKTAMRHVNSRRGSDDSSEEGTREIKSQLSELEDKYKKAMMGSAQLHNEKQALVYEVDLLKDQLEEQEEEVVEYQRQFKDKCKELESKKRSYQDLDSECKTAKYHLEQRDKVIQENGLAVVISDEGVWGLVRASSPNGPLTAGLPSLDVIDSKLSHEVDSSLGTRNLSSHHSVSSSDNVKAATKVSGHLTETVSTLLLPGTTSSKSNYSSVGVQVGLGLINPDQKQTKQRNVPPISQRCLVPSMTAGLCTISSVDNSSTTTSSPGLYVCHMSASQPNFRNNGKPLEKEFDLRSDSISEEEDDEFYDAISMSDRASISSRTRSVPAWFESSVDEADPVDISIVSADSLSPDILYCNLRVSSVDPEPEEAPPLIIDTHTPTVYDEQQQQHSTLFDDNNKCSNVVQTYLDENSNPTLFNTAVEGGVPGEKAESDADSLDFLPSVCTYKDLDEDGESTDIEYLKDDNDTPLDKSFDDYESSSDPPEPVNQPPALTASGKTTKTGYVYKSISDTDTNLLSSSDKDLSESVSYETAISGDPVASLIGKLSLQESVIPPGGSVDTQKPVLSVNPYETYIGGECITSEEEEKKTTTTAATVDNDNNNVEGGCVNDSSSLDFVPSTSEPNEANFDKMFAEVGNKSPQCSEQHEGQLMEGSGLTAAVEESSSLMVLDSRTNFRDSLGEATTGVDNLLCGDVDMVSDGEGRGDKEEERRRSCEAVGDRISIEGAEHGDSVNIEGDVESHGTGSPQGSIESESESGDETFRSKIEQYMGRDVIINRLASSPETLQYSPGVTLENPLTYPVSSEKLSMIQEAVVSNVEFEEDDDEEGGDALKYTDEDLFEILDSSPTHEVATEKYQSPEVLGTPEAVTQPGSARSPSPNNESRSRNRLSSDMSDPGSPTGGDVSDPHHPEQKTKKAHGSKKLFGHFKSWKKKDKKGKKDY